MPTRPTQSRDIRVRLPESANGMNPHLKRQLDQFRVSLECILNMRAYVLSFEDTYRCGYNLVLAGEADVLQDLMEIAVRRLRTLSRKQAREARIMFYDINMFSERTWVLKNRQTSVKKMGTLAL